MLPSSSPHARSAVSPGRQPGLVRQIRDAVGYCLAPVRLRRTIAIALVVGTILSSIILGDMIIDGGATVATAVKAGLNYVVPFVVSNLGLLSGRGVKEREERG